MSQYFYFSWEDVPVTLSDVAQIFRFSMIFKTFRKLVNCIWSFEIAIKTIVKIWFQMFIVQLLCIDNPKSDIQRALP